MEWTTSEQNAHSTFAEDGAPPMPIPAPDLHRLLSDAMEEAHQTLGMAAYRARALGDQYTARKLGNLRVQLSDLIENNR